VDVRFDHLDKDVTITRLETGYKFKGVRATRKQLPLMLSWAVTIHKCKNLCAMFNNQSSAGQGMSLTAAVVDIGTDVFEPAQAYVALSRVRTLQGLHILSYNAQQVYCNEIAYKVDSLHFFIFVKILHYLLRNHVGYVWPTDTTICQTETMPLPTFVDQNVRPSSIQHT